ncbi:MAG: phosphoglucosamine mutase [Thermoplasmata archaeon]|nr:phosphoglucosamine mutase [Thermoplasmata archaeon]
MSAMALQRAVLDEPPTAPRLFGTDGIRLVVGAEMTPVFVAEVASALATHLRGSGEVLVGRDFRTSSEAMSQIVEGSLLMHGVSVRDMGAMPTPCLQYNVRALGATMGVTVTASHNPTEFNGIKFTGPDGLEIPRGSEEEIERAIFERQFAPGTWDRVGALRHDGDGTRRYLDSILHHTDVAAIQRAAPLVILDPGNGTSAVTSPTLLRELGCRLITLNANPDGHFPGRPSEPTEENLWALRRAVLDLGAQLGIAHDGDSDRIAFVDEKGRYIPGDVTLALFAKTRLGEHPMGTVVTSVTSSTLVEDVVRSAGGRIEITRSGSLPVGTGVTRTGAVFGGEENGGYYWPEHQIARDGPMSSAKMIELLARTGRPLSELVDELPKYSVAKTKTPLPKHLRDPVVARARQTLEHEAERLVTIDGVKAFYPDGWLLVRPSGTEPICRVYAEGREPGRARELMDHGVELVHHLAAELSSELHDLA